MPTLPNYRLLAMLQTQNKELMSWNYRELMQGWIYKQIKDCNQNVHGDRYSLFTFSQNTPHYQATPEGILADTWLIRIASAHQGVLDVLERKLSLGVQLGDRVYQPILVTREQFTDAPNLESEPIVTFRKAVRQEDRKYQNPLEEKENFYAAVQASLKNRYEFFTGEIAPDIVFRFTDKPKARTISYKNRLFTAFEGGVELQTTPEMIQFAQCVGLGAKPSCGLGMVV